MFVALLVMLLPAMEAPYGLWGNYTVSAHNARRVGLDHIHLPRIFRCYSTEEKHTAHTYMLFGSTLNTSSQAPATSRAMEYARLCKNGGIGPWCIWAWVKLAWLASTGAF